MNKACLPGPVPIEISLRPNPRAKRFSLRVSGVDGRVTLSYPAWASRRDALAFAEGRAEWLRKAVARQPVAVELCEGAEVPVLGQPRRIRRIPGRKVVLDDAGIGIPGPEDRVSSRLKGYLQTLAREELARASDRYAAQLDVQYVRLSLRDTRSRWGSCSNGGGLMYSWRLVMAPLSVLDYVAAHEVAHLREMNHSRAFWSIVEDLRPDYRVAKDWLRCNGSDLHRYHF